MSPCSYSFLDKPCAATAVPCWLAYLPSFRQQSRPILVRTALILIASTIVLAILQDPEDHQQVMQQGHLPSLHMAGWDRFVVFIIRSCEFFAFLIFVVIGQCQKYFNNKNIPIYGSLPFLMYQIYSIFHLVFSKWHPTHLFSLTLLRVCWEWLYPWLHPCEEGEPNPWTGLGVGRASCWRWVCILIAPTIL